MTGQVALTSPRRMGRAFAFGLALGLVLVAVPRVPALAAPTTYYLGGDGVPLASLTTAAPTATILPNYDPGRDAVSGLVLQPTLLAGMLELDPAKYQRWSAAKGAVDIRGPVSLTLWSASEDFEDDERGTIRVGLFDCNQPAASCDLVAYDVHSADPWSPSGDWTEITVGWADVNHTIPAGHHLEVKVVVGITSETPLLFAYDTVDYPSRLTLSAGPLNRPPEAVPDGAVSDEDVPVVIDVLGNDSDPDGDALSVTAVGPAGNGVVTDNGDGTVTYTPGQDWNGADAFNYTVSDGTDTASATVAVTVQPVNDDPVAVDDEGSTSEDTPVVVDLLGNDSDVDGDPLSIVGLVPPVGGTVTDNGDGTVTYEPSSGWSGTETFAYEVGDGTASATATVTITVTGVNDAPLAAADSAEVPEDGSVTIDLLGNDADPEGDPLVLVALGDAAHGGVANNGDGSITYTPDPDWHGVETLLYTISDGTLTADGEVTITVTGVNDVPNATDISLTLAEDTTVAFDPLAGVVDVDGDVLGVVELRPPAEVSVAVESDGMLSVTPAPDWHGTTALRLTVGDGTATTPMDVTLTVTSVNDAPIAASDAAHTDEDSPVLVDVLGNDVDVDGDILALAAVVDGGSGTTIIERGLLRYQPPPDWSGEDTITYAVTDGELTVFGTVTVMVVARNDAPMPADDAFVVDEDGRGTFDVLSNDVDPDGDGLSLIGVGPARLGAVRIVSGAVEYVPGPDVAGTDTFTYTVADPSGSRASAVVTVTIRPINDAPVAGADSVAVDEDSSIRIDVLANDFDVDGDALSVILSAPPSSGSAHVAVDGAVAFTPLPDWHGRTTLAYVVSDGSLSATALVAVTVRAVNDAPVAVADVLAVVEDGVAEVRPTDNDTDVDGDVLSIAAWTTPVHGRLVPGAGALTYLPDSDFFGRDTFSYTVTDGRGGFAAATVSVDVLGVDDVPRIGDDEATTPSGQAVSIRVLGNDLDVDGDVLSIVTFTQGDHGTVTSGGHGTLIYTPGADFLGVDSFLYVVTDGITPQSAQVTVRRQIDGATLVETSLSPPSPRLWVDPPSTGDVVSAEVAETIAALAGPAAVTAAAAGGTVLAQSQAVVRLVGRLTRLVAGRL